MKIPDLCLRALLSMTFTAALAASPQASAAGNYATIYKFTDYATGAYPESLVMSSSGSLFGIVTTAAGPAGSIFELDPPAAGETQWAYRVIYSSNNANLTNLLIDRTGKVCSAQDRGVICLTPPPPGARTWTPVRTTYEGAAVSELYYVDSSGILFGSGYKIYPDGTIARDAVLRLSPPLPGAATGSALVLADFSPDPSNEPFVDGLRLGQDGSFYGTTSYGTVTNGNGPGGHGIVFRLTPPASGKGQWSNQTLYTFGPNDPVNRPGPLIADRSLTLYGLSTGAGTVDLGTAFRLSPPGAAQTLWQESILHEFHGGIDGARPQAGVVDPEGSPNIVNHNGILYGTAPQGGIANPGCYLRCGVLFRVLAQAAGSSVTPWHEDILHDFAGSPTDGALPTGPLLGVTLPSGTFALFGVTVAGGIPIGGFNETQGQGTIYEFIP